jgi:hypothetical protein
MKTVFQIDEVALVNLLREAFTGNLQETEALACSGPTYIALRQAGTLVYAVWLDDREFLSTLHNRILPILSQPNFKEVDALELCLTHHNCPVSLHDFKDKFPERQRGILGIQLRARSRLAQYSPTQMIAQNLTFQQVFENFLIEEAVSADTFEKNGGVIEAFEARQVLASLKSSTKETVMMYRGNQIVSSEDLSNQVILDMIEGMGTWLLGMVAEDGHLPYKYHPSQSQESDEPNIARQFMATLGLIRYARFTNQPDHLVLAGRNLDYNLVQLHPLETGIGLSNYDGKLNLGATAIAALALLEHPQRDRYDTILQALYQSIETAWQSDGSFYPLNQFQEHHSRHYPNHHDIEAGQALLFLASLYQVTRSPMLLEQCHQSFLYYQKWHRLNRNAAFIPWYSQTCAILFDEIGDPVFQDFIFEMNDWLLSMQQWDTLPSIDARGGFYDPMSTADGLPCAATTGEYLQSLVDAYRLAGQASDSARASTYELAIWRGLRSIRQLQFKDDIDMFYISKRTKVAGAVRTTVYDNTIRIDNVQQNLMAMLKLCHLPKFPKQAPQPRLGFQLIKQKVNLAPVLAKIADQLVFGNYDTNRHKLRTALRNTKYFYQPAADLLLSGNH